MNVISRIPVSVRHENGLRLGQVVFVEPVSPRMRRITFHAPDFADFTSAAADDHVKLFFPRPGETQAMMPLHGPPGLALPADALRQIARDYTPRRFDRKSCELTIEFVLHEDGPASNWAARAKPGDVLPIGGPRGSRLIAEDYETYLLAGDETALPSIARRLEEMTPGAGVIAFIEVADRHEERLLPTAASARIHWLYRDGKPAGGSGLLEAAVQALRLPSRDVHAWIGCEIETARRLRNYLVEEEGLPRAQIKATGYWKIGQAGAHGTIE